MQMKKCLLASIVKKGLSNQNLSNAMNRKAIILKDEEKRQIWRNNKFFQEVLWYENFITTGTKKSQKIKNAQFHGSKNSQGIKFNWSKNTFFVFLKHLWCSSKTLLEKNWNVQSANVICKMHIFNRYFFHEKFLRFSLINGIYYI